MSQRRSNEALPTELTELVRTRQWTPPVGVYRTERRRSVVKYVGVGVLAGVLAVSTLAVLNLLDLRVGSARVAAFVVLVLAVLYIPYSIVHAIARRTRTVTAHAEGIVHHKGRNAEALGWDDVTSLKIVTITTAGQTGPAALVLTRTDSSELKVNAALDGFPDLVEIVTGEVQRRNRPITTASAMGGG